MNKTILIVLILAVCLAAYGSAQPVHPPQTTLRAFVTQQYVHGIPYEQAKAYGSKAIPELAGMLGNAHFEEFRPNIVLTLGMIGDAAAIPHLKAFLRKQKGELSHPDFIAVLATFQAFGYLSQGGNREALQLLTDGADPDYWNSTGLRFSYNNYRGQPLADLVSSMAVQGLGVSGRPEALAALERMSTANAATANRTGEPGQRESRQNAITEAIDLNKKVQAQGAGKVFGKEAQK